MRRGSLLYTIYLTTLFLCTCVIIVPLLVLLAQRKSWHQLALKVHLLWGQLFFVPAGIPREITGRDKLKSGQQYIFCANHFSYLDIPAFYLLWPTKFIGKSSLARIPIFGYFFKKIHIPVNRTSPKSRAESFIKTREALDDGFNVTFFPEGGIVVNYDDLPYMARFKDGAFRLAVEKQVPIVPVVMPYNFVLLPDKSPVRFHRSTLKIQVLDPIWPENSSDEEALRLKELTFNAIQTELLRHHPDKVRSVS